MQSTCRAATGARSLTRHPVRSEGLRPAFYPSPLAWAISTPPVASPVGLSARAPRRSPLQQPLACRARPDSRPYSTAASAFLADAERAPRRGLLEWLQSSPARQEDTSAFGLALRDALAHGARLRAAAAAAASEGAAAAAYNAATASSPQTIDQPVLQRYWEGPRVFGGWSQESLLKAYASLDVAIGSVEEAMALAPDGSHTSCAGRSLPEVLLGLGLDQELFVAWQEVLSARDVRAAVVLLQQQTSPLSMSADGQPLWPTWLLKTVINRAETVAEGHLALAAIAHHLPYLSARRHLDFSSYTIRIATKLDMVTTLPILVDLALRAAPDSSLVEQRRLYLNQVLRRFSFSRAHRNVNQTIVNAEVLRVLDVMVRSEPEIHLEQTAFDSLFHAPFLATAELHDMLLLHAKRHALELQTRHIFALLDRASSEGDEATASRCMQAIEARQALDSLRAAAETEAAVDRPRAYFTPASVNYLRSLAQHPEKALAYYQTLKRPQPEPAQPVDASMAPRKRLQWKQVAHVATQSESASAERQCWAELVKIFVRWHAKMPVDDILEMIGSSSTDAAPTSQASTVCAADAAMRSLLLLGRTDDALRLWKDVFEDEGLPPSRNTLTQYVWACNNEMAPDRALGVVDNWAVRHGVHEPVPKSAAEETAMHWHTTLVRPTPDAAKPVPRILLDAHLVGRVLSAFAEAGGHAVTALRVWRASGVRWGVQHTVGMLDHFLRSAAYGKRVRKSEQTASGLVADHSSDTGTARSVSETVDEVDWVQAPTSAFLQPATAAEAEPWVEARRIFETIHLSNWPDLATVPHPFDEIHGTKLSPSLVVLSSTSVPLNAELLRQGLPLTAGPMIPPSALAQNLPPLSLYSALSPSADTFHQYMVLLRLHEWAGDMPLALAWMRARQIVPHQRTLQLAVDTLYAVACQGPLWHYVVVDAEREDDALCQEENIMFERVADLDEVAFIRKRRTKRPDLELIDWLRTWCPPTILPKETVARPGASSSFIGAGPSPTRKMPPQRAFYTKFDMEPLKVWR